MIPNLISFKAKCGASKELFELIALMSNEYSGIKKVSSTFEAALGLNTIKQ